MYVVIGIREDVVQQDFDNNSGSGLAANRVCAKGRLDVLVRCRPHARVASRADPGTSQRRGGCQGLAPEHSGVGAQGPPRLSNGERGPCPASISTVSGCHHLPLSSIQPFFSRYRRATSDRGVNPQQRGCIQFCTLNSRPTRTSLQPTSRRASFRIICWYLAPIRHLLLMNALYRSPIPPRQSSSSSFLLPIRHT